ncbi:helix-hairpin-helix domain-containing protein [Oceanobacillus manasiensis]|uniref:helix-hairpin-helix domain-containing protein n=1 Tax=Oceanobacillus manasiensis TaxID=586413 RepID=UPI0005A853A7|nr:helix-hairpin-helix domain-containing protein [Oceanobacillus manasiensis]
MLDLVKKAGIFIVAASVMVLFLFLSKDKSSKVDNTLHQVHSSPIENSPENTEGDSQEPESIFIDIKGEVNQPGVIEAAPGDRVHDMVQKAGGFTVDADQTQVNLAQKVHDEMSILVPEIGEQAEGQQSNGSNTEKVKLNYASKEEIETLSGIGPSKAEAIIAYREENGYFQSYEDLLNVSGIGEKTIEQLQEYIQIP